MEFEICAICNNIYSSCYCIYSGCMREHININNRLIISFDQVTLAMVDFAVQIRASDFHPESVTPHRSSPAG